MTADRHHPPLPAGAFQPPFCPNRSCEKHIPGRGTWCFKRDGLYTRPSDQRSFQRFRCLHCRRRFSTRTFSATYWLRYRRLLASIANLSCNGSGIRQIARCLGVSQDTVARQIARLGRHCLLYHQKLTQDLVVDEPVVVDGFETFEHSQYFPCHLNLAAGQDSWFLYHFTDSPLRRKGRMTQAQRRRRAELEALHGRPDPKAIEKAMAQLIEPIGGRAGAERRLELHSDEHPAYPRAIRRVRRKVEGELVIEHVTTPSTLARTPGNPLFPVNLADLLLRHSQANHRRETIAFSKRRQGAIERLASFLVWRNVIKSRREKRPGRSTAMELGLLDRLLEWSDVLRRRLFPGHVGLPQPWDDYYWRRIKTAVYGERQTEHRLKYAF